MFKEKVFQFSYINLIHCFISSYRADFLQNYILKYIREYSTQHTVQRKLFKNQRSCKRSMIRLTYISMKYYDFQSCSIHYDIMFNFDR